MRQYSVYPQYGSYRHMPMMPVYNSNVKIDAYDPNESFKLFYERFESMLLLNGVFSHLKLSMLKLHLKERVANDVQTQREIKNDHKRLVDYLKRNYTGEESIAAACQKLLSLKINRSVDIINVGNEKSRLVDVIYVEESHEDKLRRKRRHLAELLPVGIVRSLIKHDRPLFEPFDHTILVAKDYWDDMNAGSKMVKNDKGRNERTGKFQGTSNFCSKKGHKEIDCRDKKKRERSSLKEINFINKDDKHSDVKKTNATDMMKGEINLVKPNNNKLPIIQVKINNGESIKMLVDTGSEITILPMKFKNDNCYVNDDDVMYVKTLNDNGAIKSYKTKKEMEFKV
uniref:Peptidase A2 domain-containing protein n=1 Tax=Strongyloides papillosus TaxID=174720 RepID=A0A0N5BLW9_STREA